MCGLALRNLDIFISPLGGVTLLSSPSRTFRGQDPIMLKIYHSPGTRGFRAIWMCEELSVPYEIVPVNFAAEYRATSEWRALNPVGKVPVMALSRYSLHTHLRRRAPLMRHLLLGDSGRHGAPGAASAPAGPHSIREWQEGPPGPFVHRQWPGGAGGLPTALLLAHWC